MFYRISTLIFLTKTFLLKKLRTGKPLTRAILIIEITTSTNIFLIDLVNSRMVGYFKKLFVKNPITQIRCLHKPMKSLRQHVPPYTFW